MSLHTYNLWTKRPTATGLWDLGPEKEQHVWLLTHHYYYHYPATTTILSYWAPKTLNEKKTYWLYFCWLGFLDLQSYRQNLSVTRGCHTASVDKIHRPLKNVLTNTTGDYNCESFQVKSRNHKTFLPVTSPTVSAIQDSSLRSLIVCSLWKIKR